MINKIIKELQALKNPVKAQILQRFFKTGKGEYGEGDIFLGIIVPNLRKIAKKHTDLKLSDVQKLLNNKIHEYRLFASFILIAKYQKGNDNIKKTIYKFYLKNAKKFNNWDLVDLSAPKIVGDFLLYKDRKILYKLVKSKNLWERRISILATFTFIRNLDFADTLKISKILLNDNHDLIHKAVGWMLREIGKRDLMVEEMFLKKYYKKMPRIMLRYAIEKFPEKKRKKYLNGNM